MHVQHLKEDYLLWGVRNASEGMQSSVYKADMYRQHQELMEFFESRNVRALVVGVHDQSVKRLLQELLILCERCRVMLLDMDEDVARLYESGPLARAEFPDWVSDAMGQSRLRAVSLARRAVEPLYEYANLFNATNDVAKLFYHPLQYEVLTVLIGSAWKVDSMDVCGVFCFRFHNIA